MMQVQRSPILQMLMSRPRQAAPLTVWGGVSNAARGIMAGLLARDEKQRRDELRAQEIAANEAFARGMKPWVNPDTGQPVMTTGGTAGAQAALANLTGNPYAGKLASQLAMSQYQGQQELERAMALQKAKIRAEAEASRMKPRPDYTLNGVRYSGETNQPIAGRSPAQTDEAKAIWDRAALIDKFGEDSAELKRFDKNLSQAGDTEAKLTDYRGMRQDYTKASQAFIGAKEAYDTIRTAAKAKTSAGDFAVIYAYVKSLDPTGRITDREVEAAGNAGSLPARIQGAFNRVATGASLEETVRNDFVQRSKDLYEERLKSQRKIRKEYERLAKASNLDPSRVLIDYGGAPGDMRRIP